MAAPTNDTCVHLNPKSASKIIKLQPNTSKELLIIENNDVSKDAHLAKMFAKNPAQTYGKIQKLPQNSVLSQVMSFLPQMKKANEEMNEALASGADLDIENVEESGQVIELNLALLECDKDTTDSESEDSEDVQNSESDSDLEDVQNSKRDSHQEFVQKPESAKKFIQEMDCNTEPT